MSKDIKTSNSTLEVISAKTFLSKAKTNVSEKNYEASIEFAEKALKLFEAEENWTEFKEAVDLLVKSNFHLNRLSTSLECIDYAFGIVEKNKLDLPEWICEFSTFRFRIYYNTRQYNKAIASLRKAEHTMECKQMKSSMLVENWIFQSKCYNALQNYEQSRVLLTKAQKLIEKEAHPSTLNLIEFYSALAMLESMESNFLQAKQIYEKVYQLCSSHEKYTPFKFDFLGRIGATYMSLGDNKTALQTYLETAKGYEKLYDENPKDGINAMMLGVTYSQIGRLTTRLGDYAQAFHYHDKARFFYEQLEAGKTFYLLINLSDIGDLYEKQKNYVKQVEYCEKALKISQNEYGDAHFNASRIYAETAKAHLNLGNMEKALTHYEKALAIDLQSKGENNNLTLFDYRNLGNYWTINKKYEKGLDYYRKALEGFQNRFGSTHSDIGEVYQLIADNFRGQGKLKKALVHYQLALTAFLSNYQNTDFYHLPDVQECTFLQAESFLNVLRGKAITLYEYALTFEKNDFQKTIKTLEASLETCQLAADYLQQLHKTLKAENSKLIIGEVMPPIYQQAIQTSLLLNTYSGDNSVLERAFTFHELAKASLLRSSMKENEAKLKASIDRDLLQQEKDLRNQIETYLQKIQKEEAKGAQKDENKLKEWKESNFNELLKHQALIEQFEKEYPEYYQLKYNLETVSISSLQKEIDENTVVVSYFIGGEKGYIFAVTYDEYEVIPFDLPSNFDQQIQDYLNAIQSQNIADFIPKSHALYFLLIEPISYLVFDPFAGNPKNVVILPSTSLNYLPFETLIREIPHTAQPTYQQLDYLLQHCQIQYHYSATLYHQSLQKNKEESPLSFSPPMEEPDSIDFLGFAPIYTSDKEATQEVLRGLAADYSRWATRSDALQDGTLAPLPFSEKEVQNIEELFTQKGLKGQSLLYDTATKTHFKTLASNAKYLHIAAHGLTNDEYPKLSGIVFHPIEESTEIHDSILSMGEMYQLQLQADLVVLSSCESGIGQLAKGEGMIAINRSFLYAGAKNVVFTLFKVLDKPSSELCCALFEGILEGKTYSEALREAKLKLIEQEGVDPKSWCGFVLLGA